MKQKTTNQVYVQPQAVLVNILFRMALAVSSVNVGEATLEDYESTDLFE